MDLLTYKNIKRAGKAVKYGVAFANAYKDMSQELPINNMLPEFMTNSVFSKTMGATLKTINAMNSADDKRNCFLNGIKENLERGDVSQFEMLMQAMQAHAQHENNAAMNAMIQRMYHDIYGEGGMASGYNAPAFGVNDSFRSMMDNCSISPQNESTKQPYTNASMFPHHHYAGITRDPSMHDTPPHHPMSVGLQGSPHTMQYNHHHTGPPVSHMHNSYTVSGAPAHRHDVPRGPMVPYDNYNTPVGATVNPSAPHSNYSGSSMPSNYTAPTAHAAFCDNYNNPAEQPTVSCNTPANHSTTYNPPVTGHTVTYDYHCNTAPPASNIPALASNVPLPTSNASPVVTNIPSSASNVPPPVSNDPPPTNNVPLPPRNVPSPSSNVSSPTSSVPPATSSDPPAASYVPFTGATSFNNTPVSTDDPSAFESDHLNQTVPTAAPNNHIHAMSNYTSYSTPVYPGPPVTHTNCTSNPVVPSAPYRSDAISTTPYSSQAYSTTPQSGYRLPHQNCSNHAMAPHTAPHAGHSIHTAPTVPYNHSAAYPAPLNNHSMPGANHTTYRAHQQSNYRGYPMSKPPHGNYSVLPVSTMPGSTVITIPAAGPHNNYTVLKIPTAPANVTVLTADKSNKSTDQPTNAYRSPQYSSSLKSYSTEWVSTSHRVSTPMKSTGGTVPSVIDGRRKVNTYGHKKGFSAQKQKADAYHKVMRKNYQELMSTLPINGMMNDLVEEGVITRKLQLTLDDKQSRQDKIQCVLDKLDDSLKLGIPSTFEKLLCTMKNYGKRKNKTDLVQLVKKIRTEADDLCIPKPKRVLSQQQLNKVSQEDKVEEAHSKLAALLPILYSDDIIPDHLIKRLITLVDPQEQAEYLIERMEPILLTGSSDDAERFIHALDNYDGDDEKSVEQVKLFFRDIK